MATTPTSTEEKVRGRQIPWRDIVQSGTSILAVSGLLMYAILSIAYGLFYGALGVSPADVGLGYLTTLSSSVGAVLAFVLALVVFSSIFLIVAPVIVFVSLTVRSVFSASFRDRLRSEERGMVGLDVVVLDSRFLFGLAIKILRDFLVNIARRYTLRVIAWSTVLIALLAAFYILPTTAINSAHEVQKGNPVLQPRIPKFPLTLLAIHADPAYVTSTGEVGKARAVEMLEVRSNSTPPSLLYLGQANSTIVLYDSVKQEAVYVPSSSVLLRVRNCSVQPAPPSC